MNGILSKYISKLFIQQWIIGITGNDIKSIIRNKIFNPDIKWISVKSPDKLIADPFVYKASNGSYSIFFEEYSYADAYGKIAEMKLDKNFNPGGNQRVILDTESHLSYPFIYTENNKTYVFPEASQSGKLSCYEYDATTGYLVFIKEIISLPLLDSTIIKYNDKYWLFATMSGKDAHNKLYLFYSDRLLGHYTPHSNNPVKTGLLGSRPAGNIIEVDGILYRPAQNSRYTYGESITINRINILNESEMDEEFYMTIAINKRNKYNKGMHGIHTINFVDDIMVVDGTKWRFSPTIKLKQMALKFGKKSKKKKNQLRDA